MFGARAQMEWVGLGWGRRWRWRGGGEGVCWVGCSGVGIGCLRVCGYGRTYLGMWLEGLRMGGEVVVLYIQCMEGACGADGRPLFLRCNGTVGRGEKVD